MMLKKKWLSNNINFLLKKIKALKNYNKKIGRAHV